MMEDNGIRQQPADADQSVDFIELAQRLWQDRRRIARWCVIGGIAGLVIGFSIPKEYTATVKLAPELQRGGNAAGRMGALASLVGANMNTTDAMSPELYPDIVQSAAFMVGLFGVEVAGEDGEFRMPVEEYVAGKLRSPWWSVILSAPGKAVGLLTGLFSEDEPAGTGETDPFRLTKEEDEVVKALQDRIETTVDQKTLMVELSVTMQDPLVTATLTDTVMRNLQNHITRYRTDKARQDLVFAQKLFDEAKEKYYKAQQRYAGYVDEHQALSRRSYRTEEERLQNEMSLAYGLYNQTAQQLQAAKAKVQESMPVYAIVQPATVPLRPSKPSKLIILAGCVFLAGASAAVRTLYGREIAGVFRRKGGAPPSGGAGTAEALG